MSDPRHMLGQAAEDAVAAWLDSHGWRVLGTRRRSAGGGEVDIVGIDPQAVLVAIEVRARRSARAGPAASSVDQARVRRIRRTLAAFAATTPVPHRGLRVDLVTVEPESGHPGRWRLSRIPGVE